MLFHRIVPYVLRPLTIVALLPGIAAAQTAAADTGLSPRQVLIKITNAAGAGSGASNIGEAIADLVGLDVSTAPIGSSAGGFTFTFDPATRSFMRAAPSFGPMFGDRAITAGEGRAGVGVNFIHATYDALDGIPIDGGSLRTVIFHGGPSAPAGVATLTITSDTLVMFANLSLNRWFDASIAAPWVTLRLDGTHVIAGQQAIGSATAEGLGDIALRGKMRLYQRGQGGVALPLLVEHEGQAQPHVLALGPERERLVEGGARVVDAAEVLEGQAEIAVSGERGGIALHHVREGIGGLVPR